MRCADEHRLIIQKNESLKAYIFRKDFDMILRLWIFHICRNNMLTLFFKVKVACWFIILVELGIFIAMLLVAAFQEPWNQGLTIGS